MGSEADSQAADALCQRGNAHCAAGRFEDAAQDYRAALSTRPDHAEAQHNLGLALQNLGALSEAEAAYRRALGLRPGSALALNSLGNLLQRMDRLEEAECALRASLVAAPDYPDAHNNLAIVLQRLGRTTEALAGFRRALELAPGAPQVHMNLAIAQLRAGNLPAAEAGCLRAIALRPDFGEAYFNHGIAVERQGRFDEAERSYREAIRLQPELAGAHANLALLLLARGAFREGFHQYEWSARAAWGASYVPDPQNPARPLARPSTRMPDDWSGKRVLLLYDQGIGDEIFFLRFAPRLRAAGARLFVRPNAKVAPLLARSGWVDEVVMPGAPLPGFDLAFATSDLATLVDSGDTAAPPLPLLPLPERVEAMRARLAAFGPPPWVGVTWRAGTGNRISDYATLLAKEIEPELLGHTLAPLDARIVILQREPAAGELARFEAALGRSALDLSDANDDLENMCAVLWLLDSQVGVSNTNTHLSAALGRAARVLVPYPYEWRWLREGAESPWFPGFAVYRQSPDRGWFPALGVLSSDLAGELSALRTAAPKR